MTDEEEGPIIGKDPEGYRRYDSDRISQLEERLRRLEGQTQFETSEDNDRIKAIENRLHKLEANGDPRFGPLVERINLEVERIDALSSKIGWLQESGGSAQQETDRQIAELFNRAGEATRLLHGLADRISAEKDRLNQLRTMHHQLVDKVLMAEPAKAAWDRVLRMSSTEQDVWSAGYAEGKKTTTNLFRRYNPRVFEGVIAEALEEAASRVKRYMSNHFSEATINAIVLEVKNQAPAVMVPAEDAGVWASPPGSVTGRLKRSDPPIGFLGQEGSVYPPRPIKDNPQA